MRFAAFFEGLARSGCTCALCTFDNDMIHCERFAHEFERGPVLRARCDVALFRVFFLINAAFQHCFAVMARPDALYRNWNEIRNRKHVFNLKLRGAKVIVEALTL